MAKTNQKTVQREQLNDTKGIKSVVYSEKKKTVTVEFSIEEYLNGEELSLSNSKKTYTAFSTDGHRRLKQDEGLTIAITASANKKKYDEKRNPKTSTKSNQADKELVKENESLKSEMDELKAQMAQMMEMMKAQQK